MAERGYAQEPANPSLSPLGAPPRRLANLFVSAKAVYTLLAVILLAGAVACRSGGEAAPDIAIDRSGGEAAPDIAIELYQGQEELGAATINFSELRGRPVVLNFWAGLCPPCRAEIPHFQEFADQFDSRVLVMGLDVGQFTQLGNQEDAKVLLQELSVTYPAGFTLDGGVMKNYEVLTMPTTVFINADGEVFRKWSGVLNLEKLTEITNEMLAQ